MTENLLRRAGSIAILGVFAIAAALAVAACALRTSERTAVVEIGAIDPAVSPDGSTIAVAILGKIFLVPIEGGDARQLAFGTGWDASPAWSPDGQYLAYRHDAGTGSQIMLHNLATGTSRMVYARSASPPWTTARRLNQIAFHPTEPRIFFVGWYDAPGLRSVGLVDDTARQVVDSGPFDPINIWASFSISPDGRTLAITSDTVPEFSAGCDACATRIYTTALDSIEFNVVASEKDVLFSQPQWSRDGSSLLYLETDSGIEWLVIRDSQRREPSRIRLGAFALRQFSLHPDGESVVVSAGRKLYRVRLDSGAATSIPFTATYELPLSASADLVITNARLFDGTGGEIVEDATIEIRDGRIVRVIRDGGKRGDYDGVRVIDARGRFLMPGLVDAHNHHWVSIFPAHANQLAHGITTVLDLGSRLTETLNHRDAIELGLFEGPHIYTAGQILEGAGSTWGENKLIVTRPADAREVVRAYKEMGVSAVKLYQRITPDLARAIVEEAHAEPRIPVTGDISRINWTEAIEIGMDGVAHMFNYRYAFMDPALYRDSLTMASWDLWPDPDSAEVTALFQKMARPGFALDPTIVVNLCRGCRNEERDKLSTFYQNPQAMRDTTGTRMVRIQARLLRQAYQEGVPLLLGTDAGKDFKKYLDNLRAFEVIGIPNDVTLQAATVNTAKWLGKEEEFGTIEVGKRADLILVDGDPLARIMDLENVVLVVKGGRVAAER